MADLQKKHAVLEVEMRNLEKKYEEEQEESARMERYVRREYSIISFDDRFLAYRLALDRFCCVMAAEKDSELEAFQ